MSDDRLYCRACGLDYPCGDPEHEQFGFIDNSDDDDREEPSWL